MYLQEVICLATASYESGYKFDDTQCSTDVFVGWATQFAGYIFMKRNFEHDKVKIADMLQYYQRVDKQASVSSRYK